MVEIGNLAAAATGRRNLTQQFTAGTRYKQDLSDEFNPEAYVIYDGYKYRLWLYDQYPDSGDRQEDEAYGRVSGTWTPNDEHSVEFGLEHSHMRFHGSAIGSGPAVGIRPAQYAWGTDTGVDWNAGLEYRPVKNLTVRADAFDILGPVDEPLDTRICCFRGSDFSVEAASIGLSVKLAF